MGGVPGSRDYFEQMAKFLRERETVIVYSIEWKFNGRTLRKFFESEGEANKWKSDVGEKTTGAFTGPLKHEIVGAAGLVSFMETYGR